MSSLLLLLLVLAYWQRQQREATVTLCPRCGDLVQHAPGLPYRCPSCGGWALG